jgi:integrase/recombinase XerD
MTGIDICRMMKRRLKAAGLPGQYSPASFPVATVTYLLEQNVELEKAPQMGCHLARHQEPPTTGLYDRRRNEESLTSPNPCREGEKPCDSLAA